MTDEKKAEFELLLEKNRVVAERLINYRILNKQDADDVIQNTYLSAYRNFETLRDAALFKYWLLKIAKNECSLYFRRRMTNSDISISQVEETVFTRETGAPSYHTADEVFSKLDDNDAMILRLFLIEEKSQREIAERLGIPLGTVKSRIHYAKKQFIKLCPEEIRSYYEKGAKKMKKTLGFPPVMPELAIKKKETPFFEVRSDQEGFIIPNLGNKGSMGCYYYPERSLATVSSIYVPKKAIVHGVECVKVCRDTYNVGMDLFCKNEAIWFVQLTDEYMRMLGVIQSDGDDEYPTRIYTFLDDEYDLVCNGNERVNGIPLVIRENPAAEDGDGLHMDTYNLRYTMGVYDVTIGGRTFETIKIVWVQENTIATESYMDKSGREILVRWYEPHYWLSDRQKERADKNAFLMINGMKYSHLEDRISDYVL